MNKLDNYIWFSIIMLVCYTIVVTVMACFDHFPPAELTVGCFAFFGTEIASCAFIKRWKLKENDFSNDNSNYNSNDKEDCG